MTPRLLLVFVLLPIVEVARVKENIDLNISTFSEVSTRRRKPKSPPTPAPPVSCPDGQIKSQKNSRCLAKPWSDFVSCDDETPNACSREQGGKDPNAWVIEHCCQSCGSCQEVSTRRRKPKSPPTPAPPVSCPDGQIKSQKNSRCLAKPWSDFVSCDDETPNACSREQGGKDPNAWVIEHCCQSCGSCQATHKLTFTALEPDPAKLVWTDVHNKSGDITHVGWLKVPVLHDARLTSLGKSPDACLRVRLRPALKQPAKHGPILLHCGGPGSDASCVLQASSLVPPKVLEEYDFWSISQRSMDQAESLDSGCPFKDKKGTNLAAWPKPGWCDAVQQLYETKPEEVWKRLVGSDLSDGWNETLSRILSDDYSPPILDEDTLTWSYRLQALSMNLCSQNPEFQFSVLGSSKKLNSLEYSSTSDLARDIEIFRLAVGARKMSIYGISYGTKVGSVYATIFSDKVHHLILDGGMGTDPDTEAFLNWVGESLEAVWTGVATACDNSVMAQSVSSCPAGPQVTSKLHKLLNGTDKSKARAVFSRISSLLSPDVPYAYVLLQCIADLNNGQDSISCPIQRSGGGYYYGFSGSTMALAAVLGMDFAGRLTEESFLRWYREAREKQPLGVQRTLSFAAAVSAWPFIPRPQPPAGDSKVAPLIIGNLFDAQTPYKNAQRLGDVFPSGRVLTTQFYGHGLMSNHFDNTPLAKARVLCDELTHTYLKTGVLPRDYVCTTPPFLQLTPPPPRPRASSAATFNAFDAMDPFPTIQSGKDSFRRKGASRSIRKERDNKSKGGKRTRQNSKKKNRGKSRRSRGGK